MKKILTVLFAVATLVTLCACGNVETKVSNPNEVLIQLGKKKVTKQDLYENMPSLYLASMVTGMAKKMVVNWEVEITDEMRDEAQLEMINFRNEVIEAGEDWQEQLEAQGYSSEEALIEDIIYYNQFYALIDRYTTENFDTIWQQYAPVKAKILFFDGKEDMDKAKENMEACLAEINAGANFEASADKYNADKTSIAETFYAKDNKSLDSAIIVTFGNLSSEATYQVTAADSEGYYIVQVTNMKKEQLKDELITYVSTIETIEDETFAYYLDKYNFRVYDINAYNDIKANYPTTLVQD